MGKETFSHGQTSGITGIPPQTLRRYIHDYKEFFSESAQKPTKGRRFTPVDINNLLLIRHLYFERIAPDRIRAALRGEWQPAAIPQYNNQDALTLVKAAQERLEATGEYSKQARQAARQAQSVVDAAGHIVNRFKKVIDKQLQESQDPNEMNYKARIQDLEKRLEALEKAQRAKRGLFGLGG